MGFLFGQDSVELNWSSTRVEGLRVQSSYRVQGKINELGDLILDQPVDLDAGDVDIIIVPRLRAFAQNRLHQASIDCDIPALKDWLEDSAAVPDDFDSDGAKWQYLKEKHNL